MQFLATLTGDDSKDPAGNTIDKARELTQRGFYINHSYELGPQLRRWHLNNKGFHEHRRLQTARVEGDSLFVIVNPLLTAFMEMLERSPGDGQARALASQASSTLEARARQLAAQSAGADVQEPQLWPVLREFAEAVGTARLNRILAASNNGEFEAALTEGAPKCEGPIVYVLKTLVSLRLVEELQTSVKRGEFPMRQIAQDELEHARRLAVAANLTYVTLYTIGETIDAVAVKFSQHNPATGKISEVMAAAADKFDMREQSDFNTFMLPVCAIS